MAVYQLDIEKLYNGEYWTNRYFITADNLLAASAAAGDIAVLEQTFHYNFVTFTKFRVSDPSPVTDVFNTVPLGTGGDRIPTSDVLPLFCTVRVDFGNFGSRPYRKFYRGCLAENDVAGSFITSASLISAIQTGFNSLDGGLLTSATGTPLGEAVVSIPIQMRQLRRGRRKRTTPVLPT